MNSRPNGCLAVAITGGMGCGKSAAARLLGQCGVRTIDADDVAREVVRPGSSGLDAIVRQFGQSVLDENGALNRRRLARIVFGDRDLLLALNEIVHPRVRDLIERWVANCRNDRRDCAVVIPLLYELNESANWDFVICVSSADDTSRSRLRLRGWSDEEIDQRRAAQWGTEDKKKRADVIIENDGTLDDLAVRVRAAWNQILQKESHHG